MFPKNREEADRSLNDICFELISEGRYRVACRLLDHAAEEFKHHSSTEEYRLMVLVNRAQAYKWRGDQKRAVKLVQGEDWSAKAYEFKLAAALLTDNYEKSFEIMRLIGKNGVVKKEYYREWPLFKQLIKQAEFAEVYREIFGEDFAELESMPVNTSLYGWKIEPEEPTFRTSRAEYRRITGGLVAQPL